jgi:hypothetical protein
LIRNYQTRAVHRALHVVNRHLKTAIDKRELYTLKKSVIEKLIREGKAYKIGIHRGNVAVKCGEFLFHQKPTRFDLHTLPKLPRVSVKNPYVDMPIYKAKMELYIYLSKK